MTSFSQIKNVISNRVEDLWSGICGRTLVLLRPRPYQRIPLRLKIRTNSPHFSGQYHEVVSLTYVDIVVRRVVE